MQHCDSKISDPGSLEKIKQIILDSIKTINLDLSGFVVLTEAATGNWAYTPFIAALSNASSVICYTRDSKYGSAQEIICNFNMLSKFFNVKKQIQVCEKLTKEIVGKADIVTNSGMLRPIDKKFINSMKKTTVISLMWEPWEFRKQDLDLAACMKRGISVMGVNEDNKILNIVKYNGENILRILSSNQIPIKGKNVIMVVENKFYSHMFSSLASKGAKITLVSQSMFDDIKNLGLPVIRNIVSKEAITFLKKCDLIIINSAPLKNKIIGGKKGLPVSFLKKLNPGVKILVYFGNVDYEEIERARLECYPHTNPGVGHMPWTLDFVGPNPTIELNTLGLKVGELLAKYRLSGFDANSAERKALESPFCLNFTNRKKYLNIKKS